MKSAWKRKGSNIWISQVVSYNLKTNPANPKSWSLDRNGMPLIGVKYIEAVIECVRSGKNSTR